MKKSPHEPSRPNVFDRIRFIMRVLLMALYSIVLGLLLAQTVIHFWR